MHHEYRVADDAELHCHWDPVIPFAGSSLEQRFDIAIGAGSRLYWSDALMSGRASRGEAWRFRGVAPELRLRIGGASAYLERYRLTPADHDVTRPWIAGTANYFATALVHHPHVTAERVEALHRDVQIAPREGGVAVDLVEPSLMVARVMATSGVPFATARAAIRRAALDTVFDSPQLAGRK